MELLDDKYYAYLHFLSKGFKDHLLLLLHLLGHQSLFDSIVQHEFNSNKLLRRETNLSPNIEAEK